jgi:hypothetical protein
MNEIRPEDTLVIGASWGPDAKRGGLLALAHQRAPPIALGDCIFLHRHFQGFLGVGGRDGADKLTTLTKVVDAPALQGGGRLFGLGGHVRTQNFDGDQSYYLSEIPW